MIKILKILKPVQWLMVLVSLGFVTIQVWLDLKSPDYMQEITTLTQTPGSAMRDIWIAGGKMMLCTLGSLATAISVGFIASRVAAEHAMRLRSMLFNKVESFSLEEMNRFSTDSLITRSTNDITQVQMFVTIGMQLIVKAPITAVWALIKIAGKGVEWTVTTGVAVLIVAATIGTLMTFLMPRFRKIQGMTDDLNRVTRENLTGLRVIRAYNANAYQGKKFEEVNERLTGTHVFVTRALGVMMPVMTIVMSGLTLAIYWIGAYLINGAGAPSEKLYLFSNMVVFTIYAMQVIMSFMMLIMIFMQMPRASVSAKRIMEVLETQPAIISGTRSEGMPGIIGEVKFKHVSFKYPGAADYVLEDINFTVKQGETIAFIGSTGSGKSTLINLVPRFFDVTAGEIFIDGINVREYTLEALHNKIGYIPQRAVMFRGTVSSNVAYGTNGRDVYTSEDVQRAVKIAQGSEFVEKMEKGYDSEIAQGGTNVSGGQKQRLAIARAVCRKPEIYIFDDSFSALDYKTDRVLRSELKRETSGITSMIVAQRIGTIMDADQIVVLDEGRVVGTGTHRDLLKDCDVYRQIAMSQLSEEELAI